MQSHISGRVMTLHLFAIGAILALCGCFFHPNQASKTSEEKDQSPAIAGTIHGSPVDQSQKVLQNVSEEQLVAFLQGGTSSNGSSGNSGSVIALQSSMDLLAGETAYMKTCRANGVPIPPRWGDANWKHLGDLPNDKIFALDNRLLTRVYAAYFDQGTCAALPRIDSNGEIQALGMICQAKGGQACFWDNIDPKTKQKIKDPRYISPELVSDGSNLDENCTSCHRGDNVFIIHVGTALDLIKKRDPENPYVPVGAQSGWINPSGKADFAPKCQACHTLPKLSFNYCSTVLLPSIGGTSAERPLMPPKGEDRNAYGAEFNSILRVCKKLYESSENVDKIPWPY